MEAFVAGMALLLDPKILLVVFAGTLIGIIVGALPGISGSTTTALLLPFTITMGPVPAIAFLGAIYCAANFGGSITAILVNSPGDPSASATAFDGYPMAQRGEAGRALGMSAVASAIGGIFSVIVLIIAAPLLARVAYSFGPPEYFALAVFGLSMVAMTGGDSMLKNLIAGAFGVLLATVGPGPHHRGRALHLRHPLVHRRHRVHPGADRPVRAHRAAGAGEPAQEQALGGEARRGAPAELAGHQGTARRRSGSRACIGTFIGILPALGATTAAMIAYVETKRWSKNKERVRQGRDRGRRRPGGGQQRRGRRRDGADARARHPGQHHHRDHPRRPDRAGRAARAASLHRAADPALRGVLVDAAREPALPRARARVRQGVRAHQPDPAAVPVAGGVRAFGDRRLRAEPGDGRGVGGDRVRLHRLLHAPLRLLAGAAGDRPGARQDGRGDAEAVAADLRPELGRLPRPPDRDDALRAYRPVSARALAAAALRGRPYVSSISRRTRTAVEFASKATSLHFTG